MRAAALAITLVAALLAATPPGIATAGPRAVVADPVVADLDVAGAIPGELLVTYAAARDVPRTGHYRRATPLADRVDLVTTAPADATAAAARLAEDPAVLRVEPNVRRTYAATPDDPSFPLQWAHEQTGAAAAWDRFTGTGPGQTRPLIALIDSGIDGTHPDLRTAAPARSSHFGRAPQDRIVTSLRTVDGQVVPGQLANDCIGHGTAVAGVVAAAGDNGVGVAGVLWDARIIDVSLTSESNGCPGGPEDADIIAAMGHVAGLPEPPLVINLSIGSSPAEGCSAAYQAAVDQARAAGVAVVAAAGNDRSTRPSIPGSCDGVVSVAATTAGGERASYSQQNPQVDLAAPGGVQPATCPSTFDAMAASMVLTTSLDGLSYLGNLCPRYSDPNGDQLQGSAGTSFSSPYVAAAMALVRQLAADRGQPLDPDGAEAVLTATARDAGPPGRDCEFGWGILDLDAAVAAVEAGQRPPLAPNPPIGEGTCATG